MEALFLSNNLSICGFYELDRQGTVLFSRLQTGEKSIQTGSSLTGLNFFENILTCQNSNHLRYRFNDFVTGRHPSETFTFDCQTSEIIIPLKVMFVRVSQKDSDGRELLFYIDIKSN